MSRPEGRSSGTCSICIVHAIREDRRREDIPSDDLLERDRSLPATSAQKREGPVGERCQPILEAGQECQMDDEPKGPRRRASRAEPARLRYSLPRRLGECELRGKRRTGP